jgi:hypothetical protein
MGHLRCRKQRNSLEPSVEGPVPSDAELQAATAALPAEESPQSPSLKEQSSGFESASSTTQLLTATALPPPSMTSSSSGILKDADAGLASRLSSFQMHTGSRLSSFQSDPARHGAATSDEETGPPSAPAQPTGRRRVSDWLCGLVSCAPEWKGAVGKPLSEFQSKLCKQRKLLGCQCTAACTMPFGFYCQTCCCHACCLMLLACSACSRERLIADS